MRVRWGGRAGGQLFRAEEQRLIMVSLISRTQQLRQKQQHLSTKQRVLLCQKKSMLELHQEYCAQSVAGAAGIRVWSWP